MLQHEEYIEDQAEEAETELGRVAEERDPVVVVVRVQGHLEHGEEPTDEVQEDVADTPADCRFALVVHVSLEWQ